MTDKNCSCNTRILLLGIALLGCFAALFSSLTGGGAFHGSQPVASAGQRDNSVGERPAFATAIALPRGSVVLAQISAAPQPASSSPTTVRNAAPPAESSAEQPAATSAERGHWLLLNKAYLPPDFDQETFDQLWQTWEEPLRGKAAAATPDERRKMAFTRYGLIERANDERHRPLQYVVNEQGQWSMNCLACHQGQVAGQVIPGVPNSHYNMHTLYEEVRATKLRLGKKITHMDLGSMLLPLSTSRGTTNAVMFGVVLLNYRDGELNINKKRPKPTLTNHDHDPPPWWQYHLKSGIYIDGFAAKNHRALMQFLLVEENGLEQFHAWEDDYRDIQAWLESLRAPKYPGRIDADLAAKGEKVFQQNCAKCHGTYGKNESWPARVVPLETVKTDPVRFRGLTVKQREHYGQSWFAKAGRTATITEPRGYVAPPLHGVWASAPYFHNGAVPTLWQVLTPEDRPKVWIRSTTEYDWSQVGLKHQMYSAWPKTADSAAKKRDYYDTTVPGKSAAGHDFAAPLAPPLKRAVLEYLKTL